VTDGGDDVTFRVRLRPLFFQLFRRRLNFRPRFRFLATSGGDDLATKVRFSSGSSLQVYTSYDTSQVLHVMLQHQINLQLQGTVDVSRF